MLPLMHASSMCIACVHLSVGTAAAYPESALSELVQQVSCPVSVLLYQAMAC